jgi:cysteinyl-tRNA synthetase
VTDREKMSKSAGGFTTVDTLIERGYDPLAFRYLCLGAHYRQQLGFTFEALDGAAHALERLRRLTLELKGQAGLGGVPTACPPATRLPLTHPRLAEFRAALADDLNAPQALAMVWTMLKDPAAAGEKLALLYEFDRVLGLGLEALEADRAETPAEVVALVEQRAAARKARDWAEADRCRDAITALGYALKDTPEGPVVTKA